MTDNKLYTMLFTPEEKKRAKKMAKENFVPLSSLIKIKLFKDVKK